MVEVTVYVRPVSMSSFMSCATSTFAAALSLSFLHSHTAAGLTSVVFYYISSAYLADIPRIIQRYNEKSHT